MRIFDVYSGNEVEPVKAEGCWLFDQDENKYLDMYGGHGVISVGHSHPAYINAISEQLHKIGFYSNSVKISLQEKLAEKIGALSNYHTYQIFLCNSGAEANENALKLASYINGRRKIIAFKRSFHGRTSLSAGVTDDQKIKAEINNNHNVVFVPLNDKERLFDQMDNNVAAVIIEGIQGVGGVYEPEKEFLQYIRVLCDQFGAAMILDEIQSGCGRTGKYFAHQHAGIKPDLITMAKGIGNGFPVGAVLIHPGIQPWKGMLGTTFGGNHLACAAALSVADIINSEELMWNAEFSGFYLRNKLLKTEGVKRVKGKGLMLGVELHFPSNEIRKNLLVNHRIFTGYSAGSDTIRLLPPLSINKKEMDYFIQCFSSSVSQLKNTSDEVFYHG